MERRMAFSVIYQPVLKALNLYWDPLRIGCGWKKEDLSKPQIMIESTAGDSHPGSGHLPILVEEVRKSMGSVFLRRISSGRMTTR